MNKKLTAAFDAAKTDTNTTNMTALRDLAVPKFRELYHAAQRAARTVNRHIGVNKGTPNRATMATAIGLLNDFKAFATIGGLINEPNMTSAANAAYSTIEEIADMRKTENYTRLEVLPDFFTDDELAANAAIDAKRYLANVTKAAIAAIDSINRHVNDGTFDPNTFKIAKVRGYEPTLTKLGCDLAAAKTYEGTAYLITDDDMNAFGSLEKAVEDILAAENVGYTNEITALTPYTPSGTEEDTDETEAELPETDAE